MRPLTRGTPVYRLLGIRDFNIHRSDMTNMDETGLALGVTSDSRTIGHTDTRVEYKKSPEDRECVSVIEAVTPTGNLPPPAVIFKGKDLQTSWFRPEDTPSWQYTTSENGWTSNAIGIPWLHDIYLPVTSPPHGKRRLLLVDGHGSHATTEFMWECWVNNVYIFYLPPHSSHILQPLDLTCFFTSQGSLSAPATAACSYQ